MNNAYYITGVNGIGKTTLICLLKNKLSVRDFAVHDFDERGVPDMADKNWRLTETLHWSEVSKDNASSDISTIVCGFMKFTEILEAAVITGIVPRVCLLDANEEAISSRLAGRYLTDENLTELERTTGKSVEKFISDNVWASKQFREQAIQNEAYILDTSKLTPDEVVAKILVWIKTS